jgi:hypothetical protein
MWSLPFRLADQNFCAFFIFPICATCPTHLILLDLVTLYYIWWSIQIRKLIMESSQSPCHFLPLRCKYSPQNPVFKHPRPIFFP